MKQHYTRPLPRKHILRNYSDPSKEGEKSGMAGGFGVGFKDAGTELLSRGINYGLKWEWWCMQEDRIYHVEWAFQRTQPMTFLKGITEEHAFETEINTTIWKLKRMPESSPTMIQHIMFPEIGTLFWTEVVPKISWFYASPREHLCKYGPDLIADTRNIFLHEPVRETSARPLKAGVYIRGLWVEKPDYFPPFLCLHVNSTRLPCSSTRNTIRMEIVVPIFLDILQKCDETKWLNGAMQFLSSGFSSVDDVFNDGLPTALQFERLWTVLIQNQADRNRVLSLCKRHAFPDCGQTTNKQLVIVRESDAKHDSWAIDYLKENKVPIYVLTEGHHWILERCAVKDIVKSVLTAMDPLDQDSSTHLYISAMLTKMATITSCTSLHQRFAADRLRVYPAGGRPRFVGTDSLLLPRGAAPVVEILRIYHAFHFLAAGESECDYEYLGHIHYYLYRCCLNKPDKSVDGLIGLLDTLDSMRTAPNRETRDALKRQLDQQTRAPATETDGETQNDTTPVGDAPAPASSANIESEAAELFKTISKLASEGQDFIERNVRQRTG